MLSMNKLDAKCAWDLCSPCKTTQLSCSTIWNSITCIHSHRKAACQVCSSTGPRTWPAMAQIFFFKLPVFLFLISYSLTISSYVSNKNRDHIKKCNKLLIFFICTGSSLSSMCFACLLLTVSDVLQKRISAHSTNSNASVLEVSLRS